MGSSRQLRNFGFERRDKSFEIGGMKGRCAYLTDRF